MPTDTDRGIRRLDHPCWTITLADGKTPAGFEESEDHYESEAEAREAAPGYQCEDEPPVRVIQLDTHCWVADLLCGTRYVYQGADADSAHFADEDNILTCIGEDNLYPVQPGVFACNREDCETCRPFAIPRLHQHLAAKTIQLGELALKFGRTDRVTFHPDGKRPETDTDHTVMLTLLACSLASEFFPYLNVGLVAQFCGVHDLPEAHATDTSTLRLLGVRAAAEKEQRERAATMQIHIDFHDPFPWLAHTIRRYQMQDTAEAVFVWAVDKLTPKVCHILNGGASVRAQAMTADELTERYEIQHDQISERIAKYPAEIDSGLMLSLYNILVGREIDTVKAAEQ
jgi:5'-deoxynucleotidase YfbR-like HD superfamily hydrolase